MDCSTFHRGFQWMGVSGSSIALFQSYFSVRFAISRVQGEGTKRNIFARPNGDSYDLGLRNRPGGISKCPLSNFGAIPSNTWTTRGKLTHGLQRTQDATDNEHDPSPFHVCDLYLLARAACLETGCKTINKYGQKDAAGIWMKHVFLGKN